MCVSGWLEESATRLAKTLYKRGGKIMKLIVKEQKELSPPFDVQRIYDLLLPWDKENPSRRVVASALRFIFPESLVYCGGCHVAVHNPITQDRMLLITGTFPDFI